MTFSHFLESLGITGSDGYRYGAGDAPAGSAALSWSWAKSRVTGKWQWELTSEAVASCVSSRTGQ